MECHNLGDMRISEGDVFMIFRMRHRFRNVSLLLLLLLLLSGCTGKGGAIDKTGVGSIEYFKLDGKVDKGSVLAFSIETWEKGKRINDEMKSWGTHDDGTYKDVMVSFGTNVQYDCWKNNLGEGESRVFGNVERDRR